jgi:3-methyladenine DNA glycosylase AlkC
MAKFKDILDQVGSDVLTEETKTAIAEAFNGAVTEAVKAKVELEVKEALQEQNLDHAQKLQKVLETIDEDHCSKFKKVVQKIDEDHSVKLKNVIKHYEKLLKEEAETFKKNMVEEISNYVELYIDKTVPARQIAEACENTRAKNILEEMKKLLSIDEEYINENIREALQDGKSTIGKLQRELNEAVKENVKLAKEMSFIKSDLILEKKTQHMAADKKNYVRKILADKSPDYITENFEYVIEMFERDDDVKTDLIVEEARRETEASKIKTLPKSELINEMNKEIKNEDTVADTGVNAYLTEMSRKDKFYK